MKILHLTPAYKPAFIYGGPTMSVARLCEALVKEASEKYEIEIEVYCTRANGLIELPYKSGAKQNIDGVSVTYFKRITKDHTHFSPALLWALWKKIKAEKRIHGENFLIHIHSWWNLVVLFGALLAKIQGVKTILSPRGMVTAYTQGNKNTLFKALIHRALGKSLLKNMYVVASSQNEMNEYLQVCKPRYQAIIPNIVELPHELPKKTHINSPLFKLLFLSRIEEKKGLELLLKALAKVNFSWSLSIAGQGKEAYIEELKILIKKLKIEAKVHWLGQQDNTHKYEVLVSHDLLCLTSYNENFANVVIESLAVGTPVLVSDQVGLANYVKDNEFGFITNLDENTIISSLDKAFQDYKGRQLISEKAPNKVKKDFHPQQLADQYIELYHSVIKSN